MAGPFRPLDNASMKVLQSFKIEDKVLIRSSISIYLLWRDKVLWRLRFLLVISFVAAVVLACSSPGANNPKTYAIGDQGPAGGLVFFDQGSVINGWRYKEVAQSDQSAGIQWGGLGTLIGGMTNDGKANTDAIVSALGAGTAAYLCKTLSINGYNDWFLPSQNELSDVFQNLQASGHGGIPANVDYWTSSELTANTAYQGHWIGIGNTFSGASKNSTTIPVRAIRRFAP